MKDYNVNNDRKPNSSKNMVNQLWRFSTQIKKGDRVITYLKNTREYLVGTVIKEHFYNEEIGDSNYPNHIRVSWEERLINRDTLPQATKNRLGSRLTVFRLDEWGSEIENKLDYNNTGHEK